MITLDANDMRHMTGWELLEKLGLGDCGYELNTPAKFVTVQEPTRTWTAWATWGRGRNQGTYVHFSAEFKVVILHPDGTREPSSLTDRVHYRGKAGNEIGEFKEVR